MINETTSEIIKLKEPIIINNRYINATLKKTYTTECLCYPNFPSEKWVKGYTIYTVTVTYVIPLTIIILCYMKIIMKIVKKSNDSIFENQIASVNFTSFRSKNYKKQNILHDNKKFCASIKNNTEDIQMCSNSKFFEQKANNKPYKPIFNVTIDCKKKNLNYFKTYIFF